MATGELPTTHNHPTEKPNISLRDRLSGVAERIDANRLLLDTGEIIDNSGKLWGYRVYKGIPSASIDSQTGKLQSPWNSREEYVEALRKRVKDIESSGINIVEQTWKYRNQMTVWEQLAVSQAGYSKSENFASSWTRDPTEAIGFAEWSNEEQRNDNQGLVLQIDVPKDQCVSQEVLKVKAIKTNSQQRYPLESRPEREKEISVFDYIDLFDPNLIKHQSTDLKQLAKPPRQKLRKIN